MVTDGRMATATDAATLTLAQWFSPAYPVGAFQFSHGLERAIDCGDVPNGDALAAWIRDVVRHGSGASDVLFLSAAYLAESEARLLEVDELARAFAPSAERLRETVDMGRTFRRTTASLLGRDLPELVHPVVAGLCARLADLPLRLTASMYLQAFAANLVSVGVRLIPVGQTEGQEIIRDLLPLCLDVAENNTHGDLDALESSAFAADIASMQHETQYSRIFRT